MTQFEIARLACRVLAVYAFIQALQYLGYLLDLVVPMLDPSRYATVDLVASLVWAVGPLLLIATSWFLWRWAALIASWMTGRNLHDNIEEPKHPRRRFTLAQVHAVVFSALGLWLLIDAIPKSISYAVQMARLSGAARSDLSGAFRAATITDLAIRLVLGVWLVFGASGLVELIHRVRRVGLEPATSDSESAETKD